MLQRAMSSFLLVINFFKFGGSTAWMAARRTVSSVFSEEEAAQDMNIPVYRRYRQHTY